MGASLDEERCGQSEQEKPSTPPRAQSTAQSAFAGDDRKQVKSTPAPRRKGRKDRALAAESWPSSAGRTGPCVHNEDLTDTVQNWPSVVGRAGPLVYDDEFEAAFELEPDTDSSVVIVGEHHMAARPAARPCR